MYAAQGWATLMVNYRGSTGYGQEFGDAIFGVLGNNCGEPKDVLFGVGAALRRNLWLDPDRLGIQGGSCGGRSAPGSSPRRLVSRRRSPSTAFTIC